jgi:DNA polymerase III subunit delta'
MGAADLISFDDIAGQTAAVAFLRQVCAADRLPHALLFAGPAGVGKGTCAAALGAWLLCLKPRGSEACGKCESCRVFPSGNHPDYHVITKELIRYHDKTGKSKGVALSIEVIRHELVEPAAHTSVMNRGKFFVVEEADLMSAGAQNAMLKTLEEPSGRSAIVLLTDSPHSLLPTVLSRCQLVRFAPLETALVRKRLEKQGIDPATATEAAEISDGSLGGAMRLISEGTLPPAQQLRRQADELLNGHAPDDFPGFLTKAAGAYADKRLERDPLGSKEAATRAGLAMFLRIAAERFRARLHQTKDAEEVERTCCAIDAVRRCQMYLDANVNVPVALGQLAAAWAGEFVSA